MENEKSLKRIKKIGLIIIVVGSIISLSNGLSYLLLKLTGYPYEITPYGKLYLSPLFHTLSGILLIISGLLLLRFKKSGLRITILSIIIEFILTTLHMSEYFYGFEGDLETRGTVEAIFFIFVFLIGSIVMISFLMKKEIRRNFT
jgi:cobalamin synthase